MTSEYLDIPNLKTRIEQREFELGLAPDDTYVKAGTTIIEAIDDLVDELFGERVDVCPKAGGKL